jgi:glycosyltransferase involved in cell wall biosynthesis
MDTISVVVSCPIDTYSGYGARSRDFVKGLLADKKYDVKILSQRWGNTRFGYLEDHNEDDLSSRIIPNLTEKPDIWIQITVPNEFQPVGKFNIGVTAGMETTLVHHSWIEGCNRMNLVLTSSKHSKSVFESTQYERKDKNTKQHAGMIKVEVPIEVLLEGADLTKYSDNPTTELDLSSVDESFCYLVVGHWMQGDFGHDRKNIGYTVKAFLEAFKNKPSQPALILKTQQVGTSILDREAILDKIEDIKRSVKGKLPNVYLLHGEISDQQMNQLYNHPKVRVMVSHAKGEGFGRPLLEFSVVGKPIIASGWSGQIDFLQGDKCVLIGGNLQNVHPSAVQKDMILKEAQWFTPDDGQVGKAFKETYKSYKKYIQLAKQQKHFSKTNFSMEVMIKNLHDLLDKYVPEFPKQIKLTLPKLNLPKLEKLNG